MPDDPDDELPSRTEVAIDIDVAIGAHDSNGTFALQITMTGLPTVQLAQTFADMVKETFENKLGVPVPLTPLG